MSGSIPTGEPARFTDIYLEFSSGSVPIQDSEVTIDDWPNQLQTTLGWQENRRHDNVPPQVVGAAAVAAAVTQIAAGKFGAEGATRHPNFGWLARTRTFAGLLHNLSSAQTGQGQAPGLYLVTNFYDPRTPLLRTSTVAAGDMQGIFKGRNVRGVEADAIRSRDELYISSSIGRIKEFCGQALYNVLDRDYGLQPPDEDMMRIYSRWAIVRRFGDSLQHHRTAQSVHVGQFMAACQELAAKLPMGTKLEEVLPPAVFATYAEGRADGVTPLPVRESPGSALSIPRPRRRKRTIKEAEEITTNRDNIPDLQIKPGSLQSRIRVADSKDLDRIIETMGTGGTSCLDIRREGMNAITVQLGDCRDTTKEKTAIDSRYRALNRHMRYGQDLANGGHHNGVFEDYPFLSPGMMQKLHQVESHFARLAADPTQALARLHSILARAAQGGKNAANVGELELLATYAAASLGSEQERRQAFDGLPEPARAAIRDSLKMFAPLLTIRSLRDVTNMRQKYGYDLEEITALGIPVPQLEDEVPLHIYIPAAVSLINNPDSIYAVEQRKTKAVSRLLRGDAPPPDDAKGSASALKRMRHYLYSEAEARYGVNVHMQHANGGAMLDMLRNPIFDAKIGNLLVACRLNETLAPLAARNPTLKDNLTRLLDPIFKPFSPDEIQQTMPPVILRQYMDNRAHAEELRRREREQPLRRLGRRND